MVWHSLDTPNSFFHQKSKIPSQLSRLEFELLPKKTTGRPSAGLCSVWRTLLRLESFVWDLRCWAVAWIYSLQMFASWHITCLKKLFSCVVLYCMILHVFFGWNSLELQEITWHYITPYLNAIFVSYFTCHAISTCPNILVSTISRVPNFRGHHSDEHG